MMDGKKIVIFEWLGVLARTALGAVFVWSAMYKLRWPYMFLANVYDYEVLGPQSGILIAMTLPWIELLVGMCLLGNLLTKGAVLLATAMMGVFVFLHASVIQRGLAISCGCFSGSAAEPVSYSSLIRNCVLLLLCGICLALSLTMPERRTPRVGHMCSTEA
jgi:hypothetical protein